jgi:coniferyl-aldehyde dehydrogenase
VTTAVAPAGAILKRQRAAFAEDGIPDLATRLDRVSRLQSMILDNTEALVSALTEDFGTRAREVSVLADVVGCMGDLEYQRKHLRSWMRTRSRGWLLTRSGLRQHVRHDPLGVVGVMGPWNFPVQLTMLPAGTALAAGNRVMVRPSEITAVTTALLADLAAQYFPVEELAVLTDEQADGQTFAALEFDHLFFTGSPAVGALVAQAAGKNLVPVTLELGGKNPAVVDRSADLRRSAGRIAASRMVNGGQVCMCPDYVLVPAEVADAFVDEVLAQWRNAFPDILNNGDYTSVISERHFDHVVGLIDEAVGLGAQRMDHVPPGEALPDRGSRKIAPTIPTGVPRAARVNREEIFGPVLVVHPYRELSEAIDYVNAHHHPLTIYWYGDDNDRYDELQGATRSGSVNANDFTLNFIGSELPFGGVGHSGSGSYRGRAGFDTFTHARAVSFSRWPLSLGRMMAPPFGRRDARLADLQLATFRRRNRRRTKS